MKKWLNKFGSPRLGSYIYKVKIKVMANKKFQQIDTKAYFDFKAMAADIRMSKLTPDHIDQLKKQLDLIIKKSK